MLTEANSKDHKFQENTPLASDQSRNKFFIENTEEEESQFKEDAEPQPALVSLFEEELTLSYTANIARRSFFSAIHSMEKNIKKGSHTASVESYVHSNLINLE